MKRKKCQINRCVLQVGYHGYTCRAFIAVFILKKVNFLRIYKKLKSEVRMAHDIDSHSINDPLHYNLIFINILLFNLLIYIKVNVVLHLSDSLCPKFITSKNFNLINFLKLN